MENIISNTGNATNTSGASVSVKETPTAPSSPTTPTTSVPAGNARVAISFLLQDSDAKLIVAMGSILTAMHANKAYPAPVPGLPELTAARNAYVAAANAAKDSKIALAERREQRANVVALLRQLAHYVQVTSGGNLPTLLSSGFAVQRGRQPVGEMSAPADMRLVRGKISGQVIARCRKLPQARAYQWRCAPAATPTAWLPIVTTFAASNVFDGLVPLTEYIAQVCAVGTSGPGDWSDAATVAVL